MVQVTVVSFLWSGFCARTLSTLSFCALSITKVLLLSNRCPHWLYWLDCSACFNPLKVILFCFFLVCLTRLYHNWVVFCSSSTTKSGVDYSKELPCDNRIFFLILLFEGFCAHAKKLGKDQLLSSRPLTSSKQKQKSHP